MMLAKNEKPRLLLPEERRTRTITLTNHAPVSVKEHVWPIIAEGRETDAFTSEWGIAIRVRRHADGRAIVYGTFDGTGNQPPEKGDVSARVGDLLPAECDLAKAIRRIAEDLKSRTLDVMHTEVDRAADKCIASLPAERLD
jgi:hypothetical protein